MNRNTNTGFNHWNAVTSVLTGRSSSWFVLAKMGGYGFTSGVSRGAAQRCLHPEQVLLALVVSVRGSVWQGHNMVSAQTTLEQGDC